MNDDVTERAGTDAEQTTVRFDSSDATLASAAVIEAVVESTGFEMEALPPLYDAVDPDALDAVFGDDRRAANSGTLISFNYGGTRVYVDAEGVDVRPRDNTNGQR